MADLSILMPVYNCEKYVAQAIESIINQTYTDWELFICDDGSTDSTQTVLRNYLERDGRIKISFNPSNIGKIATISAAYKRIRGRYVVFHDSDDISHPDRFNRQIKMLGGDASLGLVGCGYVMIDDQGRILNTVIPPTEHEAILESIKISSPFHFPTVMFSKGYLDQEKNLFRNFFGDNNEDVDLSYRVLTSSKGKNIGEVLYVYRILQNSISRRKLLRNPIFFYSVAKDLALARINGQQDWLDDPAQAEKHLQKYEKLTNTRDILIYANSVSYFLSFNMNVKAISASLCSMKGAPKFKAFKLIVFTLFSVIASAFKKQGNAVLDIQEFSKTSAG